MVFAVGYTLALLGRLAWQGRFPTRFELAGAALETEAGQLDETAAELAAFQLGTDEQLADVDATLGSSTRARPRSRRAGGACCNRGGVA